ncbi:unnamed protein product, partial [Chrysoparadoxa australica]
EVEPVTSFYGHHADFFNGFTLEQQADILERCGGLLPDFCLLGSPQPCPDSPWIFEGPGEPLIPTYYTGQPQTDPQPLPAPEPTTAEPPTTSPMQPTKHQYIGCFVDEVKDRDLPQLGGVSSTPTACGDECERLGYASF